MVIGHDVAIVRDDEARAHALRIKRVWLITVATAFAFPQELFHALADIGAAVHVSGAKRLTRADVYHRLVILLYQTRKVRQPVAGYGRRDNR